MMNHQDHEVDYNELLEKLQASLTNALTNQEYHRLLELDDAVKKCSEEAMKACDKNPALKPVIAVRLDELIKTYKKVVQICQHRSDELKIDLVKTNRKKQGAQNYLTVAGGSF